MRVFVAIDLPEAVLTELEALQSTLAIGRAVPAENLHLTLSFLGEQPDAAVEDAHEVLSAIRVPVFSLQLSGIGSFGNRSPRVIFADVARCHDLLELERRITRSLRNAGLEFQKRRFRPHVTIARLPNHLSAFELARVRDYLSDQAGFKGSCFKAERFQLFQSIRSPAGVLHEALASYQLVGA